MRVRAPNARTRAERRSDRLRPATAREVPGEDGMSMFAEFRDMNDDPMWVNTDTVAFVGRAGNYLEAPPAQLTFVGGHTVAVQGTVEEAVAKLGWVYVPPSGGKTSTLAESLPGVIDAKRIVRQYAEMTDG